VTRPLIANKARDSEAAAFHRAVFKAHGNRCHFCGAKGATDAMHVIPRGLIGPKARYLCPAENGRPGCRRCHDRQEREELQFSLSVRKRAVRALNKVMRSPIQEPAA